MLTLKKNSIATAFVILYATDKVTLKTGVASGNVTLKVMWSDGTYGTVTLSSWAEVDSVNAPGVYKFSIAAINMNVALGSFFMTVYATDLTSDKSYIRGSVTTYLTDDIAVGGSGGTDLTALQSAVNGIKAETDLIGATSDTSAANTIFGKIRNLRGVDNHDITDTYGLTLAVKNKTDALPVDPASITSVVSARDSIKGASSVDNTQIKTVSDANSTLLNTITPQIGRAIGMLHENSVLDLTSYDANNNLTNARLRLYDNASHAAAAGATGLIASYNIVATYTGVNMQTYTVTRTS
jgi:hypothetical protein